MRLESIGEVIRRVRLARGYTVSDTAARAGLFHRSDLSSMEHGRKRPTAEEVWGIAAALGCTAAERGALLDLITEEHIAALKAQREADKVQQVALTQSGKLKLV